MRIGTVVFTSDHRASWMEVSDVISSGWRDARLAIRRRVFTRRWICRHLVGLVWARDAGEVRPFSEQPVSVEIWLWTLS